MKKLTIVSVLLILTIAFAGCSGATEYTLSTIPMEEAPQEVADQLESIELERGSMLLSPGDYDVPSTYAVIIDEEDISISEHEFENGILRLIIDNSQNDENVTEENGYNILVIETDLETNIATISNEDDLGYQDLLALEEKPE